MLERIRLEITALNKTRQAFAGVRGGLDRMRRAVLNVRTALAALGVGVGFKRAVDSIDALAKSASKLGLPVESLQQLRFAAEQSGVAVSTFDMAFQRFTRRAAEAAEGMGEAKAALQELGIQLRDADGNMRSTETLFSEVADALAAIENPAERVRLAFKLFDSEGVSLVNMLANGSEGLDALRNEFTALGVQLTGPQVQAVVAMKDEFGRLWSVLKGVTEQIVAGLAPGLQSLASLLTDATVKVFRWAEQWVENARVVGQNIGLLARPLNVAMADLSDDLVEAQSKLDGLVAKFGKVVDAGVDFNAAWEKFSGPITAAQEEVEALTAEMAKLVATKAALAAPAEIAPPVYDREMSGLAATLKSVADATEDVQRKTSDLTNQMVTRAIPGVSALEEAFVQLATTGKMSFRSLVDSVIADIARMHARVLSSGIMSLLSQAAGNLFGGIFGGATTPALGSAQRASSLLPNARGNAFLAGRVTPFATGGIVNAPTLFPMARGAGLMGEAGPEAILPLRRGPGGRLGVEAGGGTVVNVYAPEGSQVEQSRRNVGDTEQIDIYIDQAVARNLGRSGSASHRAMRNVFGSQQQLIRR